LQLVTRNSCLWHGRIQNFINPLCRRGAIHARVESCAEGAQGHVKLGSQYQQKKRGLKFHLRVQQTESDLDGDDRGAEGGEQFQRERREKGNSQDAHGGVAEFLADLFDGSCLRFRLTKKF
jgi:hypothetical protein